MKQFAALRALSVLWTVLVAAGLSTHFAPLAGAAEPPGADVSAASLQPADSSVPAVAANDRDDHQVTAQIQQALLADKSMSVFAQHVRIATNQQAVILRGAVRSSEIDRIAALAAQYAGSRQIDNELTVAVE
jgi:osmotically-inducible protein OsmY